MLVSGSPHLRKLGVPSIPAHALRGPVTLPWAPPGRGGPGEDMPQPALVRHLTAVPSARCRVSPDPLEPGTSCLPPPGAPSTCSGLILDSPEVNTKPVPSPGSHTPSAHARPTLKRVVTSATIYRIFFKPTPFSSNSEVSGLFLQRTG